MLLKINKKKVFTTFLALLFCFVCACMPFQIKKARAMSVGVAMAATSLLVSLYCIGMHADSSGTTNFEHVANAIQDQYRADFVEKNYTNIATGEAETRFEQLTNMWQEGIIDINSNAWASFKQWAFDTYCGALSDGSSFNGDKNDYSYRFVNTALTTSNFNILSSSGYGVTSGYTFDSSIGSDYMFFAVDSNMLNFFGNTYYIVKETVSSGDRYYIVFPDNINYSLSYRYYHDNVSSSTVYLNRSTYLSYTYYKLNGDFSNFVSNNFSFTSSVSSVKNFISSLSSGDVDYSAPSSAPFTLSLDDNEVFNQVKQIADAEIAGNTTEQLLQRAKYLNDMIGQKPKDGSQYINTLDGTKQFDGSSEDTGQAIIDGTISVPDLLQDVGVDTTVQGQVVSDPVTGESVPELATPVDLSSSVPLVVNPTLEVVFPQTYNPPTSRGGDFSFPLVNYFPFCMPYDAIRILGLFRASPEAPSISFNINSYFANIVNFANKNIGQDGDLVKVRGDTMTLDLSPFNTVAAICRFMLYVLFLIGVCFGIRNWLHGGD